MVRTILFRPYQNRSPSSSSFEPLIDIKSLFGSRTCNRATWALLLRKNGSFSPRQQKTPRPDINELIHRHKRYFSRDSFIENYGGARTRGLDFGISLPHVLNTPTNLSLSIIHSSVNEGFEYEKKGGTEWMGHRIGRVFLTYTPGCDCVSALYRNA